MSTSLSRRLLVELWSGRVQMLILVLIIMVRMGYWTLIIKNCLIVKCKMRLHRAQMQGLSTKSMMRKKTMIRMNMMTMRRSKTKMRHLTNLNTLSKLLRSVVSLSWANTAIMLWFMIRNLSFWSIRYQQGAFFALSSSRRTAAMR